MGRGGWVGTGVGGERGVGGQRGVVLGGWGEGGGWQQTYMQTAASNSNENEVDYRLQEPKKKR